MAAAEKTFESKIADLIRKFGTDFEGEVIAVWTILRRLLATRNVSFTDLGDAVEKLSTGGLEEAEVKRVFDVGYQKGVEDTERKQAELLAARGLNLDGSPNFGAIGAHVRQNLHLVDDKQRDGIADVALRASRWSLSPPQGGWLLSVFHKMGGKIG
jgi:hypothetical protein